LRIYKETSRKMENKRILNFKDFVNESLVNEGISDIVSSFLRKAKGWASSFYQAIKDGLVPKITKGPNAGKPAAMLFLPENGSITSQVKAFYAQPATQTNEAKIPLEYTGEDQSVRNISADELKNDIIKLHRSKSRGGRAKPIFIYGAPGIGKTEIVTQAADELGIGLQIIDLQFFNPEDFLGIPSRHDIRPSKVEGGILVDPGSGFTRSNPPRLLPPDNLENGEGGIIFLDEMNRANKAVLNSIMQFVQKGKVSEYQLPDKWVIIAAGNRPEEAEGVADFDFALADRFTIKNYVPTVERWSEWAEKNEKILPELVTFLTFNKDLFHYLDTDKKVLNYPTPRSWTDGALILNDEMLDSGAKSWKDISRDTLLGIFYDQVGPQAAGKFVAYLDILRKISESDIEEILNNPSGAPVIDEALKQKSVLYGLIEMTLKRIKEYDTQKLYNIMEYFNQYNQLEPLSWLYKSILGKFPEFRFGGSSTTPEDELKHKAALMVTSQAKGKGLQ
jgi:hypothetical protein